MGLCGVPSCPRLWEVPLEPGAEVPRGTWGRITVAVFPLPLPASLPRWHVLWVALAPEAVCLPLSVSALGGKQPPWTVGCGPAAAIPAHCPLPGLGILAGVGGLHPLVVQLGGRPGVSQMAANKETDLLSPRSFQLPHAHERPWEWG